MSKDRAFTAWPSLLIGMERGTTERPAERALAEWTRLLADGDDEAWRWFHGRYYLSLLRFAPHRSGTSEIVQHAYLRIARHSKPFAEEKDFTGCLCCVVRCAAVDHTRHRVRRSLLAWALFPSRQVSPSLVAIHPATPKSTPDLAPSAPEPREM